MLINKYFKLNTMVNIESDYNWSELPANESLY
jgi:hypothetical protein